MPVKNIEQIKQKQESNKNKHPGALKFILQQQLKLKLHMDSYTKWFESHAHSRVLSEAFPKLITRKNYYLQTYVHKYHTCFFTHNS